LEGTPIAIDFGTLVAGPYTASYNAVDVGFTLDGFRVGVEYSAEMINQTDLFGDMLIDMIYRGGNGKIIYNSRSYKPGSLSPFWPWGALGVMFTAAAPIARSARAVSSAFVMTAVANTPAAAAPATLTASKAILSPNTNAELLFDSKVRNVPTTLVCLPYESAVTGTAVLFTTT
jgi:hypothetical protein